MESTLKTAERTSKKRSSEVFLKCFKFRFNFWGFEHFELVTIDQFSIFSPLLSAAAAAAAAEWLLSTSADDELFCVDSLFDF